MLKYTMELSDRWYEKSDAWYLVCKSNPLTKAPCLFRRPPQELILTTRYLVTAFMSILITEETHVIKN